MKRKPKLFKIMFSDLSENKQKEYLDLSKLKPNQISDRWPLVTLHIDPEDFVTEKEFFESIKNL